MDVGHDVTLQRVLRLARSTPRSLADYTVVKVNHTQFTLCDPRNFDGRMRRVPSHGGKYWPPSTLGFAYHFSPWFKPAGYMNLAGLMGRGKKRGVVCAFIPPPPRAIHHLPSPASCFCSPAGVLSSYIMQNDRLAETRGGVICGFVELR